MQDRFIVNVCLTGMIPTKQMNENVPITPEEIARDVQACIELGASIFHVHARDNNQDPDWRKETYQMIFKAIRAASSDAIICASTSGRMVSDIEKRIACLDTEIRPDMASITMGSINFLRDVGVNTPEAILAIAQAMQKRGIKPEIEIFDIGMARTTARMIADGTFRPPYYANIILGNIASADASLQDLTAILSYLPSEVVRCIGGIGKQQSKANTLGILFGNGVRVGLEDNLHMDEKKTLATNVALVDRIVRIGKLLGKVPFTITETRKLLDL